MNILEDYKYLAENFSIEKFSKEYINKAYGISFELEVNDKIINNERDFFLYYQIAFEFSNNLSWSVYLQNPFTNNEDKVTDMEFAIPAFNQIVIDHIIIKPYGVFVLESKNHNQNTIYTSQQISWVSQTGTIINPVYQVLKYSYIIKHLLAYYNINLPVIPRVLFRQKLNLENISEKEQLYCCHISELHNFIKTESKKYPNKNNEALKLVKALYYNTCHPIAYDTEIWR